MPNHLLSKVAFEVVVVHGDDPKFVVLMVGFVEMSRDEVAVVILGGVVRESVLPPTWYLGPLGFGFGFGLGFDMNLQHCVGDFRGFWCCLYMARLTLFGERLDKLTIQNFLLPTFHCFRTSLTTLPLPKAANDSL